MEMAKCILIVDDCEQVRTWLRGMLEDDYAGLSFRCEEANDGRQGITKALQLKPDLIVLDLSMPVMNGLDAAYELKRLLPEVTNPDVHEPRGAVAPGTGFVCGD